MTTYNSNLITQGAPGKYGVYPTSAIGTLEIAQGVILTQNDVLNLCNIAPNAILEDFVIDLPDLDGGGSNLRMTLEDSQDTPLIYVTTSAKGSAAGIISMSVDLDAPCANFGFVYTAASVLRFLVTTTAAGATGSTLTIRFRITFAPA